MSTKDKVAQLLILVKENIENRCVDEKNIDEHIMLDCNGEKVEVTNDGYVSGELIADHLGLSRVSIWKAIKSLEEEGYCIDKKRNKGYKILEIEEGVPLNHKIKMKLNTSFIGGKILYFKTIDSTNTYLSKVAESNEEGTIILSSEQKNGKGRIGRKWESNSGGIFMSLLLKPQIPIGSISFITQIASAAIVSALKKLGCEVSIKWPNDIILNDKKIAGILTEMSAEIDRVNYVIVGMGINHRQLEFDDEIEGKATSIEKEGYNLDNTSIMVEFLEAFEKYYIQFLNNDREEILKIVKENSAVIGREIYVIGNKKTKVFVEDIDYDGSLVVKHENGKFEKIFTGEVSIRGLDNYI